MDWQYSIEDADGDRIVYLDGDDPDWPSLSDDEIVEAIIAAWEVTVQALETLPEGSKLIRPWCPGCRQTMDHCSSCVVPKRLGCTCICCSELRTYFDLEEDCEYDLALPAARNVLALAKSMRE